MRVNAPWGQDSDEYAGRLTLGERDRYTLQEMRQSVRRAADEPLSGKRAPRVDPDTGEWLGWIGSPTLKPEWMRDQGREYFGTEETDKALATLLAGKYPRTAKQERIAAAIEHGLRFGADEEKRIAFGGVDPADLPAPAAGGPLDDTAALAALGAVTLPSARPRVQLDADTGTLILGPRSPLKGQYHMVNPTRWRLEVWDRGRLVHKQSGFKSSRDAEAFARNRSADPLSLFAPRPGVKFRITNDSEQLRLGAVMPAARMPSTRLRAGVAQADTLGPLFGGDEGPRLPFGNPRRRVVSAYSVAVSKGFPYIAGDGAAVRGVWMSRFIQKPDRPYPALFVGFAGGRAIVLEVTSPANEVAVFDALARHDPNPLTRSETAAVLLDARTHKAYARTLGARPGALVHVGKAQGLLDVARTFGKAGGAEGWRHRAAHYMAEWDKFIGKNPRGYVQVGVTWSRAAANRIADQIAAAGLGPVDVRSLQFDKWALYTAASAEKQEAARQLVAAWNLRNAGRPDHLLGNPPGGLYAIELRGPSWSDLAGLARQLPDLFPGISATVAAGAVLVQAPSRQLVQAVAREVRLSLPYYSVSRLHKRNPLDRAESARLLARSRRAHDSFRAASRVGQGAQAQYQRGVRDGLAAAVADFGVRSRFVGKAGQNPLDRKETADLLRHVGRLRRLALDADRRGEHRLTDIRWAKAQEAAYLAYLFGAAGRAYVGEWKGGRRPNPLTKRETAKVLRDAREAHSIALTHRRIATMRGEAPAHNREEAAAWDGRAAGFAATAWAHGKARRAWFPSIARGLRGNPPARVLGAIPGRMTEIRYNRAGRDRGPYFHRFGRGVRAFAMADGSVVLRGPRPLFVKQ